MIYTFDLISTIYPSHHDVQQNISHCHWGSKVGPSPNPSLWCMRCLNVHPLSGATSSLPAVFARLPRKPWILVQKKNLVHPNKAIKSGKDMARKVDDLLLELYKHPFLQTKFWVSAA